MKTKMFRNCRQKSRKNPTGNIYLLTVKCLRERRHKLSSYSVHFYGRGPKAIDGKWHDWRFQRAKQTLSKDPRAKSFRLKSNTWSWEQLLLKTWKTNIHIMNLYLSICMFYFIFLLMVEETCGLIPHPPLPPPPPGYRQAFIQYYIPFIIYFLSTWLTKMYDLQTIFAARSSSKFPFIY